MLSAIYQKLGTSHLNLLYFIIESECKRLNFNMVLELCYNGGHLLNIIVCIVELLLHLAEQQPMVYIVLQNCKLLLISNQVCSQKSKYVFTSFLRDSWTRFRLLMTLHWENTLQVVHSQFIYVRQSKIAFCLVLDTHCIHECQNEWNKSVFVL